MTLYIYCASLRQMNTVVTMGNTVVSGTVLCSEFSGSPPVVAWANDEGLGVRTKIVVYFRS